LGGLVGATISLLFTPESGEELRAQIRQRAESFGGEVHQAVNTKRIELQDRLESLKTSKTQ
jgi:gas vesicle protein